MDLQVQQKLLSFFTRYKLVNLKKEQLLISPHKKVEGVYLLIKGHIRMYSLSPEGAELSINSFRPPSFFPMDWVLNTTENRFFYDATLDSELFLAPKNQFTNFLTKNPDVMMDLLKRIYSGLEGYMLKMETLLGASAYVRLLVQLIILARRSDSDQIKLPQKYLASETGLARETIAREIKKLRQKKLIHYHGNTLVIANLSLLEKELVEKL